MANPVELQEKLKILSDAYAAQLPEKLKQLELTWNKMSQTEWDEEGFQILHRMAHSLTGSGKTFGFAALSEAARKLETLLKQAVDAKRIFGQEQRGQVQRLLSELKLASFQRDKAATANPDALAVAPDSQPAQISRHVFIVEDDHLLAHELKVQLSYFGYDASVFNTLDDFRSAVQQNPNGIMLMDIDFPEDSQGGIHVMTELQHGRDKPLPVVFLSAHTELDFRLGAVRAGGVAFLSKPVNVGVLIDKLDELTSTQVVAAYRVLIVDDSASLANYYAAALEQAGMLVTVVADPLNVLNSLFDFSPDLILLDMYMPGCNGMELAQAIRQIDAFISIPIVFLSAETNLDKQLSAVGLGGDDFLTKPIEAQHLISSVSSRIKRSLVLRSFMVRDSLTGLLNHTAIKERLNHEVARAKRQGKPLAFAMVDIDHFKKINDTYGHPVGDRVIRSLSRLLKQRLRENDLVGRYGGEEFAVIIVDADSSTAMKIIDTIRNDFAQLHHLAGDQEFTASFSCGVADISNYDDSARLTDAADKALYNAKHAGRNQIMKASKPLLASVIPMKNTTE